MWQRRRAGKHQVSEPAGEVFAVRSAQLARGRRTEVLCPIEVI